MMEEDATTVCGARHRRHGNRRGYRWGHTQSEIGYHGGRVKVQRPRVRDHAGKEVGLESWQVLRDGNLLVEWALNLMVLNVSTRKYHRPVRRPRAFWRKRVATAPRSRPFPGALWSLSRKKMKAWLASDLSDCSTCWSSRSTVCMSATMSWWRRSASMATATSMSWPWSRGRRRTRSSSRPCSTISAHQGAHPAAPAGSSSMARRTSAKRSATPSVWPPPSSAARSLVTSSIA